MLKYILLGLNCVQFLKCYYGFRGRRSTSIAAPVSVDGQAAVLPSATAAPFTVEIYPATIWIHNVQMMTIVCFAYSCYDWVQCACVVRQTSLGLR